MVMRSSHCHHKGFKADVYKLFSESDNNLSPRGAPQNIVESTVSPPLTIRPTASLFHIFRAKEGKK